MRQSFILSGERYVNPFTDFGFKRLFGTEANKDLLIDFLNSLLDLKSPIVDLTYKNTEKFGDLSIDRKAVFDIYCTNKIGESFIVEMQKAKQNYFKDRSVFYSTFPIREQAEKGEWDYNLKPVYLLGILDFVFKEDENENPKKYKHVVELKDDHNKVFYDKLKYVYLEMPRFTLEENELKTNSDKWLYILKNLSKFQDHPARLQERIFKKVFKLAELANLKPTELAAYEESLKVYRDNKNILDTAFSDGEKKGIEKGLVEGLKKGIAQGIEKERITLIKSMFENKMSIEQIHLITKIPLLEIKEYLKK